MECLGMRSCLLLNKCAHVWFFFVYPAWKLVFEIYISNSEVFIISLFVNVAILENTVVLELEHCGQTQKEHKLKVKHQQLHIIVGLHGEIGRDVIILIIVTGTDIEVSKEVTPRVLRLNDVIGVTGVSN